MYLFLTGCLYRGLRASKWLLSWVWAGSQLSLASLHHTLQILWEQNQDFIFSRALSLSTCETLHLSLDFTAQQPIFKLVGDLCLHSSLATHFVVVVFPVGIVFTSQTSSGLLLIQENSLHPAALAPRLWRAISVSFLVKALWPQRDFSQLSWWVPSLQRYATFYSVPCVPERFASSLDLTTWTCGNALKGRKVFQLSCLLSGLNSVNFVHLVKACGKLCVQTY